MNGRCWPSVLALLSLLAFASPARAATSLFTDGFESGDYSAWTQVQTGGNGMAVVQSATVRTGGLAAQLSETATSGSKAYARKTFSSAESDLTASGDFRVVTQGASGGNVPFFRLLSPAGARLVSLYRQNGTLPPLAPWVTTRKSPLAVRSDCADENVLRA